MLNDRNIVPPSSSFKSWLGYRHAMRALAPVLLIAAIVAVPQARAQTAMAAQKVQKGYSFDVALTPKFLAGISDSTMAGYNAVGAPMTINGKTYNVVSTRIAWVPGNNSIDNGRFAFARGGSVDGAWWHSFDTSDPGFADFAAKLKAMAEKNGDWSYVTLTYLTAAAGEPAVTSDYMPQPSPVPTAVMRGESANGLPLRQKIAALSNATERGQYFKDARVPVDLAATRQLMLDYGNKERFTPAFRANAGAKVAIDVDLSKPGGPKTIISKEGKTEPVFTQPDMKLDDRYNKAAQWFAEALAVNKGYIHQYPDKVWTDPAGVEVTMTEAWDRAKYFGIADGHGIAEIAAPGWGSGDMPYGWMAGDTHYRWYFGVDGIYPLIGYGAAQGADGKWYYVGLADHDMPAK